jgi:Large polyvalent protein-associated domain 7
MFGTNSVEPVQTADSQTRKPRVDDDVPIREATPAEQRRHRPADAQTDAIAKQHNLYTNERWKTRIYYSDYQQKSEVMRAKPQQITTKLDDRQTVSAMLDLAQSRGWQTVKLRGSEAFKREVWVQAQVRGIKAEGYQPKNTDLQEADRRKTAAVPVAVPIKEAPAPREAKKTKATETAQRSQEKAVWNVVETNGKQARQQDSVKPTEKPAEKPSAAAVAA